jgi:hypothetical protein
MGNRTAKDIWIACILAFLVFAALTPDLYGQLHKVETPHLNLIYTGKALEYLTPHVVNRFERSWEYHQDLFDYAPTEKVTILLQDFWDYGTGGTSAIPNNRIAINVAPFSYVYETRPANERINWLMNHELVHVVASDKASGTDSFFRTVFLGKVSATADDPVSMLYSYLTTPRWYSPRWYHEGIAVFLETWMAGGLGRALGAYDEMVFRTMIRDGSYIYHPVGLESEGTTVDFQVGANSYLYGTRFFSYLALKYGPESLLAWVSRTGDSKRYFASQFRNVYGVSLNEEWSRWIDWEHTWQQANLERIRSYPTTPYRTLSRRALGSVSRGYLDAAHQKLYAAVLYPGETAHIAAIDLKTGDMEKICDIRGAALYYVSSVTYDPDSGTIFFTTDNGSWRDLVAVETGSGKSRQLMKDVRTGDLAYSRPDRSIWGIRHYNGISTIVRIPYPYKEWNHVHSFPYGRDLFDLDISPDGTYLVGSLTDISGLHQELVMMETDRLVNGDSSYEVLFDFGNSTPANFTFSADGRYLFGSSYYSGVSNIYRYDTTKEDMDIISNCETGFFRPIPVSDDSLIAFRYTGAGFIPCMIRNESIERAAAIKYLGQEIVKNQSVVTEWTLARQAPSNPDSLITDPDDYSLPPDLRLVSAYPIVVGYKAYTALGVRLNFEDQIGLSNLRLKASYSPNENLPDEERLHLNLDYQYWGWSISSTYNGADFYDLFGPTKTSRKGYSLSVQYKKTLLWEDPRTLDYCVSAAGYGGLERLPDYQNIASAYDRSLALSTALSYQDLGATLGATDYEKGVKSSLVADDNLVNSKHFPRVYANLDYGLVLPIEHTSIWLRASAGHAFGDREDPFANFYFGGFGNNWVDHLDIRRYREYYSFPGAELNAVEGRNYGKLLLECLLPPIRFRRLGFTSAYLRWAHASLFASGIMTNVDSEAHKRELLSLGGQIDFRLVTFSLLNSTFSLGYAVSLEEARRASSEFMASLKIL